MSHSAISAVKSDPWANRIVGYGEEVPDQMLANPRNWRIHPDAQQQALSGVLREVGIVQNVIVNQRSGYVVDGHARVALAISAGQPTIPVTYVDLSEDEEALILAALDPIAAMAVADRDQLGALLESVQTRDAGLLAMLQTLAVVKPSPSRDDPGADLDRTEELREKWGTERGQLWQIGPHRLLCGDSTNAEDVARLMGGEKAGVLWTDPPYGVDYVGKTGDALTIQNDSPASSDRVLEETLRGATGVLIGGAPFYIAHPPGGRCLAAGLAVLAVGWHIHQDLVWAKDAMVLGHSDYHWQHEPILYGFTPGHGRPGRGAHEGSHWYGNHAQVSVFSVPRPKRSEDHPTMKPPELVALMLNNSSQPGAIVYDPFLGSGSTMVAAEQLSRRCYAMEIEPKYVAVALERMAGMGLEPELAH